MTAQHSDGPATARQVETLTRLALLHGRQAPKAGITRAEAADAIRWMSTRRKSGEEFAPVPTAVPYVREDDGLDADPEMAPYMTLRHWDAGRPGVRKDA